MADVNNLIIALSKSNEIKYYVHNEELFNIIHDIYLSIGHGGRNKNEYEGNRYKIQNTKKPLRNDYDILKCLKS